MRREKQLADKYLVKALIWHTGLQAYCEPGSVVQLKHLAESEINYLIRNGVIEPLAETESDITEEGGE